MNLSIMSIIINPLTIFFFFFIFTLLFSSFASAFTIKNPNIKLSFILTKQITDLPGEAIVSWSTPSTDNISQDWISLWWEPVNATYISYDNVTSHSGSIKFSGIINARHRYVFRYFRGDDSIQETEFFSPFPHTPMQPRITTIDEQDPTKIRISWTSDRISPKAALFLGTSPNELSRVIYALNQPNYSKSHIFPQVDTYTFEYMNQYLQLPPVARISKPWPNIGCRCLRCGMYCYDDNTILQLWADPGYFMNVEVDNLIPGQTYYYNFGEVGGVVSSQVRSFRALLPPSNAYSINLLYVADGGIGDGKPWKHQSGSIIDNDPPVYVNGAKLVWNLLNEKIRSNNYRFDGAIFNGDINYARGNLFTWEIFHNLTSNNGIFDRMPVLMNFGNHDLDYEANPFPLARGNVNGGAGSGGEAGVVTGKRFLIDYNRESWYRRSMGPVTILSLNTEHKIEPQLKWLKQMSSSKSIDRSATPWLVVFMHRPMYSLMAPDNSTYSSYLQQYADVFDLLGVDLVLQGHQHQYTRFCAISSEACNTWGYQAIYTTYRNQELTPEASSECTLQNSTYYFATSNQCRVSCNKNEKNCTGVVWDPNNKSCLLMNCSSISGKTQFSFTGKTMYFLSEKRRGNSPVYIVDGTAGAEFTMPEVKHDERVRYTDVKKWGFSTLTMNATTLHWQHFHLDERLADDLILKK